MNRSLISLLGLTLLQGCTSFFEHGFRTQGTYIANRSGYQMQIISQGIRETDQDYVIRDFVRLQICPLRPGQGRPVRLSLASELNQSTIKLDSEEPNGPVREFSDQTTALYEALRSAGYKTPDPVEMKVIDEIVANGIYVEPLSSTGMAVVTRDANGNSQIVEVPANPNLPDGPLPDGTQIDSRVKLPKTMQVVSQSEDYTYKFNRRRPKAEWIRPDELAACASPSTPAQ